MSRFPTATVAGLPVRLLLVRPDWRPDQPVSVTHQIDTSISEGRTTIEERRALRGGLGITQKATLQAVGQEVDDWRKGLAALSTLYVAMPLWVDMLPVSLWSTRIYDPQQILNYDPTSDAFVIYDQSSLPATPTYPYLAPLLVGRWDKRPAAQALSGKAASIDVELKFAAPWACRIGIHSYGSSWAAAPDWTNPPTETSDYGLELTQPNPLVEPALDRVNAAARWTQDGFFTFADRLAIRQALSWFVAKRGAWQSWYPVPAWLQAGGADTAGTPSNLTARFSQDTLSLDYISGATATAQIGFTQEVYTPSVTQAAATEAYLYQLAYLADTSHPDLFTNFDSPLTLSEGTYQPRQAAHKNLRLSLRPQDEKFELSLDYRAGELCDDFMKGRLFARVQLTLWKCDPSNPGGTRGDPLFCGYVTEVLPDGALCTITATLFGDLLKNQAPGWLYAAQCNTWLTSPQCTLTESAISSTGTVARADLSADGLTLTARGLTGFGGPSYADQWFAAGELHTGSGRLQIVIGILKSETSSSGVVLLHLERPLWSDMLAAGGQACTLLAGCGRQYDADCIGKFSNGANFRGMPFIPSYLQQVDTTTQPVKRK